MGLKASTRDAGATCDVKVIGAWRLENVAPFQYIVIYLKCFHSFLLHIVIFFSI